MSSQPSLTPPSPEETWRQASLASAHRFLSAPDRSTESVVQALAILAAELKSITSFFAGSARRPGLPQRENFVEKRKLGTVPVGVVAADGLCDGTVCLGYPDGTIRILAPDQPKHKLVWHAGGVSCLRAIDDKSFVTSGDCGGIIVWRKCDDGKWSARKLSGNNAAVTHLEVLRDGKLVSAGEDGKVLLLEGDANDNWAIRTIRDSQAPLCALSVSPAGRIVSASIDSRLVISSPNANGTWSHQTMRCAMGAPTFIRDLPDGSILAGNSSSATMWIPRPDGGWLESTIPALEHVHPFPDGRILCADQHPNFAIWSCSADGNWRKDHSRPSGGSSFKLTVLEGGEILEQFGYLDEGDWIELMKVTHFKPDGTTRYYTSYWGRGSERPRLSGKTRQDYDPGFTLSDGGYLLLRNGNEGLYYNWDLAKNPCQS